MKEKQYGRKREANRDGAKGRESALGPHGHAVVRRHKARAVSDLRGHLSGGVRGGVGG